MTTSELVSRIEKHCRDTGVAETTFGRLAVNDGKLVARLRAGKSITLETLGRIEAAISAQAERAAPVEVAS